jgi:hypothetical protein
LPEVEKEKAKLRIAQCCDFCPRTDNVPSGGESTEVETASLRGWLEALSSKNADSWLEQLEDEGYETVEDLLDAEEVDRVEVVESITNKKPLRKKLFRAINAVKGTKLYVAGRGALNAGEYSRAKQYFSELMKLGDTELITEKVARACESVRTIIAIESAPESICVFDRFSQSLVTMGLSMESLGLSTQTATIDVSRRKGALLMYLDREFPDGSEERTKLVAQLYTDMCTALKIVRNRMHLLDLDLGSVVVYFEFVEAHTVAERDVAMLRTEYLRQVGDSSSELWTGQVTQAMNKERTLKLTQQLEQSVDIPLPCIYNAGDTITLAQVQEEVVECKLESLLGEGATSTVFKVSTNGKTCALKVFKARSSFVNLSEEASLLLMANHPQGHSNVLVSSLQRAHQ